MVKMIVSDLDESLLRTDGTVSPADVATIRSLSAHGVKFVPNTGRGFASVQPLLETIGTAGQADQYVISYNGGAVVENGANTILRQHPLDYAVADAIYQQAMQHPDLGAHIYTFDQVYVVRPTADEIAYLANRGVTYTEFTAPDLHALAGRPIAKVIFEHPEMAVRQAFAKQIASTLAVPLTVTYSSDRYVEFNPAGIDKGDAAIALGATIGIAQEDIIALGDNANDLSMIQKAGLGVAVANAIPAVKEAAGLVLTATNDQDPVTELAGRLFPAWFPAGAN